MLYTIETDRAESAALTLAVKRSIVQFTLGADETRRRAFIEVSLALPAALSLHSGSIR